MGGSGTICGARMEPGLGTCQASTLSSLLCSGFGPKRGLEAGASEAPVKGKSGSWAEQYRGLCGVAPVRPLLYHTHTCLLSGQELGPFRGCVSRCMFDEHCQDATL